MFRVGWVVVCLGGCFVGAGPVAAVRTNGTMALGWEAATSLAYVGAETGQSYALGPGPTMTYGAARVLVPVLDREGSDYESVMLAGGSIGKGGAPGNRGLMLAAWPAYGLGWRLGKYQKDTPVFMVSLGIRWFHGTAEVFLAPKAGFLTSLDPGT